MTNKILTPLTPMIDGYRVVIVQEANPDGTYGAYIGCTLQSPDNQDNDRMMLLGDAFEEFRERTAPQEDEEQSPIPALMHY
jgi:hypothetical protein